MNQTTGGIDYSLSDEDLQRGSFARVNLLSVLLGVLKRPWILFVCLVLVMVPTFYHISRIIPIYRSTTKIMVSVQGFGFEDQISLAKYSRNYNTKTIKYYTSILDSRAFKKAVRDFIDDYRTAFSDKNDPILVAQFNYTVTSKDEGFLDINAISDSKNFAPLLAEKTLEIFKERSVGLERQEAQGILDFIDAELQKLITKMEKAGSDLQNFLTEKNLIVEDIEVGVGKQLFDLEKQLAEASANLEMVEINIDSYTDKINEILDQITSSYSEKDEKFVSELRGRLNEIKDELNSPGSSEMSTAEVNALYSEMNSIRNELVNAASNMVGSSRKGTISDVTLQQLELALDQALLEREKYKSRVDFYSIQVSRFRTEHPNLSKDILEFANLTRSKDVLKMTMDILLEKREEARIKVASERGGIKVIDEPNVPFAPIDRNKTQKIILGLLASLGLGILISGIIDRFDNTIKDENDVRQHIGLSVFGTLPVMVPHNKKKLKLFIKSVKDDGSSRDSKKMLTDYSEKSPVAEAYRSLKTSIQFLAQDKGKKIFTITSPGSSEGKSLTSVNLGISFAQGGMRTLVIDCDLRRPVQHKFFGFDRKPGLTNHFFGEVKLQDIIKQTPVSNLFMITAGTSPPNPAELVGSRTMKDFLAEMRKQFDIVIVDTPPIMACVDSRVLSQITDGMIIVSRVESTKIQDLVHATELVIRLDAEILGVILNQVEFRYGYAYYYAYRYYNPYSYYYGSYNYYYYYDTTDPEKKKRKKRSNSKE